MGSNRFTSQATHHTNGAPLAVVTDGAPTGRLHTIGSGRVGHYVIDGATLCKRDASVSSPVATGTPVCKPCAVVAERQATAVERADVARTAAEIADYADQRKTDTTRIVNRLRAEVAEESATVTRADITRFTRGYAPATRVGGALADRASMVAPLSVRPIGTVETFRIPFSHNHNRTMSTVWEYIAEHTMGSAFSARVISRMRKDLPEYVFSILASEIDDVTTHTRIRAYDALLTLMTSDDVTRHDASHVCDTCTRVGTVGDDASPFGARTVTYSASAMADGTTAFTYDRPAQCGECDGCASTSDNRWLTRHCESPVMIADHVSVGAVVGRAMRSAVRSYNSRSKRNDRAAGDTFAYVTAVESADDVDSMGVGSNVPAVVADMLTTVCNGLALAGADVIGSNGKATDDALTVLAIITGNVTRTDAGIVASPNQRRTAVEKVRTLWTSSASVLAEDDDMNCLCRWNVSGVRIRQCVAHGGTRSLDRAMSDVVGTRYVTNNRPTRSGSANVATSPVAGRTISADDLASAVVPDMH